MLFPYIVFCRDIVSDSLEFKNSEIDYDRIIFLKQMGGSFNTDEHPDFQIIRDSNNNILSKEYESGIRKLPLELNYFEISHNNYIKIESLLLNTSFHLLKIEPCNVSPDSVILEILIFKKKHIIKKYSIYLKENIDIIDNFLNQSIDNVSQKKIFFEYFKEQ